MKRIIKIITFCFLLFVICKGVIYLGYFFTDYTDDWMFVDSFYKKKNNSLDVIIYGSSHVFCSYNGDIIKYISSLSTHNFASSGNGLELIYENIKSSLRTQKPKYVVIEMLSVFGNLSLVNTDNWRLMFNLDMQPLTRDKLKVIDNILQYRKNSDEAFVQYVFSLYSTHANYKQNNILSKGFMRLCDKNIKKQIINNTGFSIRRGVLKSEFTDEGIFEDLKDGVINGFYKVTESRFFNKGSYKISDDRISIMKKIYDLSKKKGFKVIYTFTPYVASVYDPDYAEAYKYFIDILKDKCDYYIDFNILKDELGINSNWFWEPILNGHTTDYGATQMSIYMGNFLAKLEGREPRPYDNKLNKYQVLGRMLESKSFDEYIKYFKQYNKYMAIISSKDDTSRQYDKFKDVFHQLGLKVIMKDKVRNAYVAVVRNDGKLYYENVSKKKIEKDIGFGDNHKFQIVSGGLDDGDIASIKFDGAEQSKNRRGINIVIYDLDEKTIIDSINIDTCEDPELKINR